MLKLSERPSPDPPISEWHAVEGVRHGVVPKAVKRWLHHALV